MCLRQHARRWPAAWQLGLGECGGWQGLLPAQPFHPRHACTGPQPGIIPCPVVIKYTCNASQANASWEAAVAGQGAHPRRGTCSGAPLCAPVWACAGRLASHSAQDQSTRRTCNAHIHVWARFGSSPQPDACVARLGACPGWGTSAGHPFAVGLRAIPDGLRTIPPKANHRGGRGTYRYMSGHSLAAVRSRMHAWRGWEPVLGGAPVRGTPLRWGYGPYRMACGPFRPRPTTVGDVEHIDTCLGTVWQQSGAGCMRGGAVATLWNLRGLSIFSCARLITQPASAWHVARDTPLPGIMHEALAPANMGYRGLNGSNTVQSSAAPWGVP